jgi:molybdate transport system substrate-binding protein
MKFKFIKNSNLCSALGIMIVISLLSACEASENQKLTIATAANAQFAIEAIANEFEEDTGIAFQIIVGSSGKHTAQIEAGAPYDVFVSADLKFPQKLHDLGLTLAKPGIYAYGKLVIWTLNDSLNPDILRLLDIERQHIAMPNPKTAPYGRAAKEALDFYGLYDQVSSRLVFGESVAQTNQFILSESAALGFTAASIVTAPTMINKGKWQEVDENTYSPIAQGAVVIKQSSQLDKAKKFYLFLFSPTAINILQAYGYTINEEPL